MDERKTNTLHIEITTDDACAGDVIYGLAQVGNAIADETMGNAFVVCDGGGRAIGTARMVYREPGKPTPRKLLVPCKDGKRHWWPNGVECAKCGAKYWDVERKRKELAK